jgi:DNA repair protein RadC
VGPGGLLAYFLDASNRVVLRARLEEGTRHVDELFLRHLTALVEEIDATRIVLVSVRYDGHPRPVDRLLWREMRRRLTQASSVLADLLIVGGDRWWSIATRRRLAPPLTEPRRIR